MTAQQTTDRPAPNTLWRARDGRLMRLDYWMPDRAKPTAFMVVINPGHRQRRYSEQAADGFGSFGPRSWRQPLPFENIFAAITSLHFRTRRLTLEAYATNPPRLMPKDPTAQDAPKMAAIVPDIRYRPASFP